MASKKKENLPLAKVPLWFNSHFRESLKANLAINHLIHLSEGGIRVLQGMPKAVSVLAKVDGTEDDPKSKERLERAEKDAELAKSEVENDFPLLHGLAVVGLWSWLEHFVKGSVSVWVLNRKDASNSPQLQKVKIRYGDYVPLTKQEKVKYVIDLLEQDLSSPQKTGVNRFESLLDVVGLSGPVPEKLSKTIFELQQVRNVVAHRNGIVDRRLVKECPWLKLKAGKPLRISRRMVEGYGVASVEYAILIMDRVKRIYGVPN